MARVSRGRFAFVAPAAIYGEDHGLSLKMSLCLYIISPAAIYGEDHGLSLKMSPECVKRYIGGMEREPSVDTAPE
ncbi:hypothetical protein [Candidatus Hakubella thermalkaliphila]|uniref:hypothetical protein n=1 Tax=Candidatus Hakubella thermalkaliphila TaxID=2754717 RepID=UPI0015935885|nr:hypothetical protein [Candidatus Hakubella thermalkaliphila]